MLVEDGRSVRLLADPARVTGARRFYGAAAVGCGAVAVMALGGGSAVLLLPGQPAGIRGLAIGFAVAVLLFGALTWWFGRALHQVRAFAAQGYLLECDDAGLTDPRVGRWPWSNVRGVTVSWRPVRSAPPIGLGGRLGQAAARGALERAGQDRMVRMLTVDRTDGPPVRCSGGAMAADEDFARFVGHLEQQLAARGIPYALDRGPAVGPPR